MARLLILIFTLNAFFTPVSAMGVCEMMGESGVMVMPSNTDAMSDMACEMNTDTACNSVECASNCTSTMILQSLPERQNPNIVAGHIQPHAGFAYFYRITYPVNTPPPLV